MAHIPNWPKSMLVTLLFEEADAKTTITFIWESRNPTAEEIVVFEAKRGDHCKGWGVSMQQLHITCLHYKLLSNQNNPQP